MKNVLRVILIFTIIIMQTSCASVSNGKNASFDKSVNGIKLLDPASYISVLGKGIRFYKSENIVYTQHYNSTGDEMLTIISSPKNKFCATKFRVAKLDKKFLMKRNVMQDITKFSTEKGIYLGMTPMEVLEILGDQYDKEIREDGVAIYRYKKTNIEIDILKNDSLSDEYKEYKSVYHFYRNKLVEFIFGF
jgi:hypothetical protein